jgi:hypothetical protein
MNEEIERRGGANVDEAADLDAGGAAVIMQQASDRARRELRVPRPALFATWGIVVLASYGALWLSVRGQRPFHGATAPSIVTVVALVAAAVIVTVWFTDRASSGVGGRSVLQRGSFFLALAAGILALEIEKEALSDAGASRPVVALLGEAVPLLVVGVVFIASSVSNGRLDWARLGLGLWLLVVVVAGSWSGPVRNLVVCALAGGGGILLMAVIEPRLRRP